MTGWTVIIPVKPWGLAKSRLDLRDDDRMQVARAFSLDVLGVVAATASVERIVVVTAEAELGLRARRAGAKVVVDRPLLARGLLNHAIDSGRRHALVEASDAPIAVLPADLPSLTVETLGSALELLAGEERSFVPDASGVGTTLLAAARPALLTPHYGPQSARCHERAGHVPVDAVDRRCRRDVDTAADLAEARYLGVGPHTTAALEQMTVTIREGRGRDRVAAG